MFTIIAICLITLFMVYRLYVETFVSFNDYQDSSKIPVLHFDMPRTDFLNFSSGNIPSSNGNKIPNAETFELATFFSNAIQQFINTKTSEKTKVSKIRDIEWVDNHDNTRTFIFKTDILFTNGMFSVPITASVSLKNASTFLIRGSSDMYFIVDDSVSKNISINSITVINPEAFTIHASANGVIDNVFYIKNKFGLMHPFKTSYNEFVKN